ncbi:NUDIX domain-containing protein [Patescibacteria group bacterium]|nr:NUDIX domain-containing protein [Patescibacteria group bacterium]
MRKEKELAHATVCFLNKENKILLAIKSRHIGEGCWNGYGGGIDPGEKPREAAVRELKEETGGVITLPDQLEKIAEIDFHNTKSDGGIFVCKVHFYLVKQWQGEVQETEEMLKPTWFDIKKLPLDEMMPADKKWLSIALSGKKVKAQPKLGPFQKKLLEDFEIEEVDSFDED